MVKPYARCLRRNHGPVMPILMTFTLEANGLHRSADNSHVLAAPYVDSSVHSAWNAIEKFFNESELQKRPITDLFTTLQARPFGMKMGVIPVLFGAAAIVHDTEIAFYESGAV